MKQASKTIVVIGAGINGLVAANLLQRAGHQVTLIEKAHRVGGACVSETAKVEGVRHDYALGASTLGLMQDFVWRCTGLADVLEIWAPEHPDLVYFPGDDEPVRVFADSAQLDREFSSRWGERGDLAAFQNDLGRVVRFLHYGYRAGRPPNIEEARTELGAELVELWITGSARRLLEHYLTAERTRVFFAQDVMESGPVSIDEPCSAFQLPIMSSGSVFGGDYGYVRGGIWRITQELNRINMDLGVRTLLSCRVNEVDAASGRVGYETPEGAGDLSCDHIMFATDPQTAARLTGNELLIEQTQSERVLGTSGKLNLMFRRPVQWRQGNDLPESDTAFRYLFAEETLDDLNAATGAVLGDQVYAPGYFQIYCEGAAMRRMGLNEPFDRLAVFFKNLALGPTGEELAEVENAVKALVLERIANPEDCAWSRLLTPRDLQQAFGFPGGNIEHTMLVEGQTFADRGYARPGKGRFYQFGASDNLSICGSGAYPCGSVAGTPAWMCVSEWFRHERGET